MEVKASLKYLRISPRKVRLVADLIRGLPTKEAEAHLLHISKKSSRPLLKLLKSAIAGAEQNFHLDKDNLFIRTIRVDEGPVLKRWRPRARGATYPIRKRTSHIFLTLQEIKEKEKEKIKKKTMERKEIKKDTGKGIKNEEQKKKTSIHYRKAALKQKERVSSRPVQKQKMFRRKAI